MPASCLLACYGEEADDMNVRGAITTWNVLENWAVALDWAGGGNRKQTNRRHSGGGI
jgi:hypothetical protein